MFYDANDGHGLAVNNMINGVTWMQLIITKATKTPSGYALSEESTLTESGV